MNNYITKMLVLAAIFTLVVFPAAGSDTPAAGKPNILYIMVDDLGKEWVSCYGAEDIKTPNIDALAASGMKFHNAYSMPACTPTRTTLLTGKYPWRTGYVNHWDVPRWGVGYFDWKKKENTTFARLMKDLGYATEAWKEGTGRLSSKKEDSEKGDSEKGDRTNVKKMMQIMHTI